MATTLSTLTYTILYFHDKIGDEKDHKILDSTRLVGYV
jgi:hypothetical protein